MRHSLLDYRPSIAALEGAPIALHTPAAWPRTAELRQAADLLEHAAAGTLEAGLHDIIDRVDGGAGLAVHDALASVLARVGRPLLRQHGAAPRGAASRLFGLELEGLSPEDQAFEVARHFVRFVADATRQAGRAAGGGSPPAVARRAVANAARRFAPGLQAAGAEGRGITGRWFRRGRQLIVLNP